MGLLEPTIIKLESFPEGAEYNGLSGLFREAHKSDNEGLLTKPQLDQVFERYVSESAVILLGKVAFDAASEPYTHGFLTARWEDESLTVDELFVDPIARNRRLGTSLMHFAIDTAIDRRLPSVVYRREVATGAEHSLLRTLGFQLPEIGYPRLSLYS